jgi:hypothetical protein
LSKTDKTRPWRVRAQEAGLKEQHNHRNGVCDLPADPSKGWGRFSGCHYTESHAFYYGPGGGCGCPMCSGQYENRQERRRDRHRAAQAIRRGVADEL